MSKRHALRSEAANDLQIRVLVSTGLHRSGPRSSGKPACGATDETTCGRCACQTGATPVARTRGGPAVRRGTLADADHPTVTRAHFLLPFCTTWVPSGTAPSPATTSPSHLTAPCSIDRRASRFESAKPVATRASAHGVPLGNANSGMSLGAALSLCTRSNSASAASPAPAPWYRSTTVRPTSRLAAFGCSAPLARSRLHLVDFFRRPRGRVREVHREQLVGDAHDLAELLAGRLVDPDVVAERLRHLLLAVEADEQRRREHDLRLLAGALLQMAAHDEVEELVGAAELDVGADLDRVHALQQRVQELHQRDRRRPTA